MAHIFTIACYSKLQNLAAGRKHLAFKHSPEFLGASRFHPTPPPPLLTNPNGKPWQIHRIALVGFQEAKPRNLLAF